jgi:ABC-2 type transport system permease protein
MRPPPRPGLWLVATREIRFFRHDRAGYLLVVIVPLIAFAVLAWTFGSAVVRGLDVAVVDADRSATSARLVQTIAATPGLRVAERDNNLQGATRAIRSGDAIAAVYIPPRFELDLRAGRRPQIIAFYNAQYFTPGNIAARGLSDAIDDAISRLSPLSGVRLPQPGGGRLVAEEYVLTNPALNYAGFLLRAIMPTTLHVVIGIAAAYAVGTEFSRRSRRAWLRAAGPSPLVALAGKLLPLFVVFFALLGIEAVILHAGFELPYRGNVPMMVAAAALFVVVYLSLAALLVLLVRDLALGLSLVAIIASPAFGYAGVGMPILAMSGFARAWGALLPLRWYQQILFDQAARGAPLAASAPAFAVLAAMAIGLFLLAWWRLSRLALDHRPEVDERLPPDAPGRGVVGGFAGEWRRVLADRGVFSMMIIAPAFYGIFYPQPYLGQLVRKIPIAVVDDDNTELSRRLIQTLDADEAISVAIRAPALDVAQQALFDRRVFGILEIPPNTERDVLKGDAARLPTYVDSSYFLVFNRTLQGILEAVSAANIADVARGLRLEGAPARLALAAVSPAELLSEPLYNPTGGYASYVVPAAFVLIIQRADHPADLADGRRDVDRAGPRAAAGNRVRGAGTGLAPRPGPRASDGVRPGTCLVSDGAAADLRLFDPRRDRRPAALCRAVRPCHELHGSSGGEFLPASGDGSAGVRRDHSAAILSGRRILAARNGAADARPAAPHLPERVGNRRPRAHRADGRAARRGARRLASPVAARHALFHPGGRRVAAARGARRCQFGLAADGGCIRSRSSSSWPPRAASSPL